MGDDRAIAESALRSDDPEVAWPPVAARIRMARERLGISQAEIAAHLGMGPSEYWDIEFHDDEAFLTFSVSELGRLALMLGVPLCELLFGSDELQERPGISFVEVADHLKDFMIRESLSIDELSERAGWELGPVLADAASLSSFNLMGLFEVCELVGIDWVAVLPRPGEATA